MTTKKDREILEAAAQGFRLEAARLNARADEIDSELRPAGVGVTVTMTQPRARFSASARKKMADAQKKRWKAFRANKAAAAAGGNKTMKAAG